MRTWNSGIHNYRKWDVVRASFADEWHSHSKFWHSQIWHSHSRSIHIHNYSHSQVWHSVLAVTTEHLTGQVYPISNLLQNSDS